MHALTYELGVVEHVAELVVPTHCVCSRLVTNFVLYSVPKNQCTIIVDVSFMSGDKKNVTSVYCNVNTCARALIIPQKACMKALGVL